MELTRGATLEQIRSDYKQIKRDAGIKGYELDGPKILEIIHENEKFRRKNEREYKDFDLGKHAANSHAIFQMEKSEAEGGIGLTHAESARLVRAVGIIHYAPSEEELVERIAACGLLHGQNDEEHARGKEIFAAYKKEMQFLSKEISDYGKSHMNDDTYGLPMFANPINAMLFAHINHSTRNFQQLARIFKEDFESVRKEKAKKK